MFTSIIVTLFSLVLPVAFGKYVFILCDVEKFRSLLAAGTERVDKI
jgi:hypothetical protein